MVTYAPGTTATLTAEFLTSPGGVLVDVTGLTIAITDPSSVVEVAATGVGITHPSTGVYRYAWAIPVDAAAGDHLVLWSASGGTTATDLVNVSDVATGWCTLADVVTYTGVTVDAAALARASAVIDLHLGRTYYELVSHPDGGEVKIGRRDQQWIRQALAYQAAWMASQPDMFARLELEQANGVGRLGNTALVLAPLARKALKRVSWLRSRSLHVRTPFTDGTALSTNMLAEVNDAVEGPWLPLGAT